MVKSLNQWLFLSINNLAGKSDVLDKIGVFLGEKGPYIFMGLIIYIYFKKQNKKEAVYATITVILAILLNHFVELFYYHPRPFADGLGVVLKEHIADSSFPSDHTTFMLALSWSLTMFKDTKKWGRNMLILGVLSGLCRVFEGVHYPFDILGALVMGYFSAVIIYRLKKTLKPLIDLILKIDNKLFRRA
ncbi:undecaprenyl-diphosphatase [Fusobacteria bacterium ZRK30]|nr:undecaprenyl-diphosphatase [Fusobacteria bacterium ZRK30]